jgi:SSS family solute:Na+ symporter
VGIYHDWVDRISELEIPMTTGLNWPATLVFIFFFFLVAIVGFLSARLHPADLNNLSEWGLGGRRFGVVITWFLLGGDFYTAYTIIAFPAFVYGAGAIAFYALPYAILIYPFFFVVMPRLWLVCKRRNYLTLADFTMGRYGSRSLALAVAVTGILATVPYIALQLIGMQVTISALGVHGAAWLNDLPLAIAFIVLAAFAYTSGLRAPASIAFLKDTMVYIFVVAAVIWIPLKFGGFGHVLRKAGDVLAARPVPAALILPHDQFLPFATLAIGSALAVFLYPHAATGVLSASSSSALRVNASLLPIYTLLLGFLGLLGYIAIAADIHVQSTDDVLPLLVLKAFPSWFAGFCLAAVAIGALVPAAIMAIAASNLFTRNIYREYLRPLASAGDESAMAKSASVVIILSSLLFVIFGNRSYAIVLQLLGGVWIMQTLPTILVGLFVRWFDPKALISGWFAGMVSGTGMVWSQGLRSAVYPMRIGGTTLASYAAIDSVLINLIVAAGLTVVLKSLGVSDVQDETLPADYGESVACPASGK